MNAIRKKEQLLVDRMQTEIKIKKEWKTEFAPLWSLASFLRVSFRLFRCESSWYVNLDNRFSQNTYNAINSLNGRNLVISFFFTYAYMFIKISSVQY